MTYWTYGSTTPTIFNLQSSILNLKSRDPAQVCVVQLIMLNLPVSNDF